MSKYGQLETVLRDQTFLVAALREMGYQPEIHTGGDRLFGYQGDPRSEVAHVIIRRSELQPASNDIGFARIADGRFTALLSEYDQAVGYDRAWLGRVQQAYKEKQTIAAAKAKGYAFKSREVVQTAKGPQVRLQFVAR